MNKSLKLLLIFLSIFIFIIILIKDTFLSFFDNNYNSSYISDSPTGLDYYTMTEEDFDKLSIKDRWIYRSKCLDYFKFFINDYQLKNYIYPLPIPQKNNKIFINIASYRDPECNKTIKSLIYNSNNWKNLRIVVCQQNAEEDTDCLYDLDKNYISNIEVIRLSYKEARGPTFARFLIQQKYNSEEYYMQIDSHTIFEKDWDSKLIKTLNELQENSCLTQYLPHYKLDEFETEQKLRLNLLVSRICSLDGFTRINSSYANSKNINTFNEPFTSNSWSGCFSFSRGNICIDAPIDCYTPDVFFGEEMDITLRLFTHGWNFYSPNYPIAYTNFNRTYRDTFWKKKGLGYNKNITLCSRLRIHYRLGTLPEYLKQKLEIEYPELLIQHEHFRLGKSRTLKDYENLIGFNFSNEIKIKK